MPLLARQRARGPVCLFALSFALTGQRRQRTDLHTRLLEYQVGNGANRAARHPGHFRRPIQLHRSDATDECMGRRQGSPGARQAQRRPGHRLRSAPARSGCAAGRACGRRSDGRRRSPIRMACRSWRDTGFDGSFNRLRAYPQRDQSDRIEGIGDSNVRYDPKSFQIFGQNHWSDMLKVSEELTA